MTQTDPAQAGLSDPRLARQSGRVRPDARSAERVLIVQVDFGDLDLVEQRGEGVECPGGRFDVRGDLLDLRQLVGLVIPSRSHNIELKPYGVSSVVTNNVSTPVSTNKPSGDFGGDFKYGLTRSLIADVTYNTDFAQIEEDVQQVNLTRFNLLFPEKRDFFLEGQGIYAFGGRSVLGSGAGDTNDVPVMVGGSMLGTGTVGTSNGRAAIRLSSLQGLPQ